MAQSAQGEVLGHVTDLGVDFHSDSNVRGHPTKLRLPFHDDNADIVALPCLLTARSGGLSRLVSSTHLHDVVRERRPELMAEMASPWYLDRRGEIPPGKPPYYTSAFSELLGDRLFCRCNRACIESAQRLPETPRLTLRQIEALDLMDSLCHDPSLHLEMPLERGGMQFVNNYAVLHSRSKREDWPEPERHRDWKDWQLDPRPPIFDLSVRRAALGH